MMIVDERYTKGAGNAALGLRCKRLGQYWDFVALAAVSSESADTFVMLTEYPDAGDAVESSYVVEFTPPDGDGWTIEIVDISTGLTVARGDTGSPLQDNDARLPATVIASKADVNGSFLGLLYSVIAMPGVEVEFLPIKIAKGEHRTFSWEIKEGGVAKDISSYTAKMGIKFTLEDTIYELGPIDGVISANSEGVMSILSFTLVTADTAQEIPCDGLYAVALYKDGEKYPLTQAGGVDFALIEDILDIPVVP